MSTHDQDLIDLVDRQKIRDCLARLARGEDRRNTELIIGAYRPCALINYGIFTGTFDEYLAWVIPGSPNIPVTQHVLGQSFIDLHVETALIETHVLAYHRIAGPARHRDCVIGGRYIDRMEKLGSEWRIAERTMLYDWYQDFGEAVDWSAGLMGMPFDTNRYAGRAIGDPSECILGDGWPPETHYTPE